jgi:tRNA A37 N6-isopentenylltransferase MiaA
MDIVEFAEKVCGMELLEYQKESLRRMHELSSKGRIYILPRRTGGSYIYIDDTMRKELIHNGTTNAIK